MRQFAARIRREGRTHPRKNQAIGNFQVKTEGLPAMGLLYVAMEWCALLLLLEGGHRAQESR